jgi:WD40 repeat protein
LPGLNLPADQGSGPVPVYNCLPDGFTGTITNDAAFVGTLTVPLLADGHWWWYMLGQGWVAEDWLAPVQAPAKPIGAGLIAFTRQDGVWLMNADGGDQRLILPVDTNVDSVNTLSWSPDGTLLAVGLWLTSPVPGPTTRLIDVQGVVVAEYPLFSDGTWSPRGGFLAGYRWDPVGLTSGLWPVPVTMSLQDDSMVEVGPHMQGGNYRLTWSADGLSLAYTCFSSSATATDNTGGSVVLDTVCEGGDGLRVVPAAGGPSRVILPFTTGSGAYYSDPSWSPTGESLVVLATGLAAGCSGFLLINPVTGESTTCIALPTNSLALFGRCGGDYATGASAWSNDGRRLAYHTQATLGESGLVLVDVITGEETKVPSLYATSVEFSPDDSRVLFAADNHIWTAGADGGSLARLAQGGLPVWQPVP